MDLREPFFSRKYIGARELKMIGNESVPIQWHSAGSAALAFSDAKIKLYFSNTIYGSNFIKQHSKTVVVGLKLPKC